MFGQSGTNRRQRRVTDWVATGLVVLGSLLVLTPLLFVLYYLISQGIAAVNWDFFTKLPAPVGQEGGGVAHAIVGSGILLLIASAIGITLGVGAGIFIAEFPANRLVPSVRLMSDVLLGIPAIVMGLVAYGIIVSTMGHFSALSGGVALGFIMIPYVVRATEEVLKLVPRSVREAGYALGLPRWRIMLSVVLPSAAGGIITGVMLALARVAGEAAPLLFTAFGNRFWNLNLTKPIAALPLVIYNYSISPYDEWHRLASAASLILVVFILLTTLITRFVFSRRPRR